MPTTHQLSDLLRPLVDRFVTEIEGIVRQAAVKAIQDSIGAGGGGAAAAAPSRRKPGRPPKSAPAAAPAKAAPKAAPAKPAAPAKSKGGGTRIRRSPEQIEAAAQRILTYIRNNPNQGAEVIKNALGLRKQDWMLPITRLLDTKQVTAKGEKRSRTYAASK